MAFSYRLYTPAYPLPSDRTAPADGCRHEAMGDAIVRTPSNYSVFATLHFVYLTKIRVPSFLKCCLPAHSTVRTHSIF